LYEETIGFCMNIIKVTELEKCENRFPGEYFEVRGKNGASNTLGVN
jgi:hypothetical protein